VDHVCSRRISSTMTTASAEVTPCRSTVSRSRDANLHVHRK
jgi:hypothetical protein